MYCCGSIWYEGMTVEVVMRGTNGGSSPNNGASSVGTGSGALGFDADFFFLVFFLLPAAAAPPQQTRIKARRRAHCHSCKREPQEPDAFEPRESPEELLSLAMDPVLEEAFAPEPSESSDADESPELVDEELLVAIEESLVPTESHAFVSAATEEESHVPIDAMDKRARARARTARMVAVKSGERSTYSANASCSF